MRFTVLIAILSLLFPVSGFGAEKVSFRTLRAPVDYAFVTAMVSRTNENKEDFLRRAGGIMEAYTLKTGYEVCSVIYEGEERTGLYITTNNSHIGCITVLNAPMEGMSKTGEGIHTHPVSRNIRLNKNDEIFSGFRMKNRSMFRAQPEHFSDTDYQSGAGYLAVLGKLKYQNGVGSDTERGDLLPPDQTVVQSLLASN